MPITRAHLRDPSALRTVLAVATSAALTKSPRGSVWRDVTGEHAIAVWGLDLRHGRGMLWVDQASRQALVEIAARNGVPRDGKMYGEWRAEAATIMTRMMTMPGAGHYDEFDAHFRQGLAEVIADRRADRFLAELGVPAQPPSRSDAAPSMQPRTLRAAMAARMIEELSKASDPQAPQAAADKLVDELAANFGAPMAEQWRLLAQTAYPRDTADGHSDEARNAALGRMVETLRYSSHDLASDADPDLRSDKVEKGRSVGDEVVSQVLAQFGPTGPEHSERPAGPGLGQAQDAMRSASAGLPRPGTQIPEQPDGSRSGAVSKGSTPGRGFEYT
jgi:hypothetical protein